MAESSIPVDLFNPGQVFACLGFLEAADILCRDAEGGFDWSDEAEVRFCLQAVGRANPFAEVLKFLAGAKVKAIAPAGWRPKNDPAKKEEPKDPKAQKALERKKRKLEQELSEQEQSEMFSSVSPETSSAMPIRIAGNNKHIVLGHWADGSSRNEFKLYSGNRSAYQIAGAMLQGIVQLWTKRRTDLIEQPFDITTPMGGSFNFDPRGGWTAIDAGYSPDRQEHKVAASPVVEILAAWGLENARPDEYQTRKVRYSAWGAPLPPMLARTALFGGFATIPTKRFHFELHPSGNEKRVTFAEQEI